MFSVVVMIIDREPPVSGCMAASFDCGLGCRPARSGELWRVLFAPRTLCVRATVRAGARVDLRPARAARVRSLVVAAPRPDLLPVDDPDVHDRLERRRGPRRELDRGRPWRRARSVLLFEPSGSEDVPRAKRRLLARLSSTAILLRMATKADFTDEEWKAMQEGIAGAGMYVAI